SRRAHNAKRYPPFRHNLRLLRIALSAPSSILLAIHRQFSRGHMSPLLETIEERSRNGCAPSKALLALWSAGADLRVSPRKAGRLCELAVVAAAGKAGMLESEIVAARRAYAASLGVTLSGAISNADEPVHIHHAVSNSNHNPNASNRINLGRARAYKERREEGDYFFIDT
ncbi:hypothetical protein ACF1LP_006653, partial [Pseudomonas aeruginosa]